MKLLVTGASGFIGRHVIQNLVRRLELGAEFEIIATSRDIGKLKYLECHERIQTMNLDLSSCSRDTFGRLGCPDLMIHLAWEGLPHYLEPIHLDRNLADNMQFIKSMLEAGLNDITVAGTCLEYGMRDGCLSEEMPTQPANAYGIAKDTLRKYIEIQSMRNSISWKWLRLFYTYGRGQAPQSLTSQIERSVEEGAKKFNMSGGEQLRDYLPVEAVADYIVQCAMQTQISGVINCCSGRPISVRRFVETYLKEKGYDLELNLGFYPYPKYEPMGFWGNTNKLDMVV